MRILIFAIALLLWPLTPLPAQPDNLVKEKRTVIYFMPGSSEVTPAGKDVIKSLVEQYAKRRGHYFYLSGHTDSRGEADENLLLSARMANAVAAYMKTIGVNPHSISLAAFGESILEEKTRDGVGEPLNRRVVINVYVPKGAGK